MPHQKWHAGPQNKSVIATNVFDQIEAILRRTVRERRRVCEIAARNALAQGCGFLVVNYRDQTIAMASPHIPAGQAIVSDQYDTDSQPHERNRMAETQDPRLEAVARAHAGLGVDEPWPSNEDLGGDPTGTRDDEFRAACFQTARELLTVADNADPVREGLRKLLDDLRNTDVEGRVLTVGSIASRVEGVIAGDHPVADTRRALRALVAELRNSRTPIPGTTDTADRVEAILDGRR